MTIENEPPANDPPTSASNPPKIYETPTLTPHGSIEQLTQDAGPSGATD